MSSGKHFLTMAKSCLRAAVLGEWDIFAEGQDAIWGRAVVKSLNDTVMLSDKPLKCNVNICYCDDPLTEATSSGPCVITIRWGDSNYATLEHLGREAITWRLAPEEDGTLGERTFWRRRQLSADVVAESRKEAPDESAAVRAKAASELAEARAKAAEELAALGATAAGELASMRTKLALSDDLAEARANIADDIAEESMALRKQLNAQVACSEALQVQLQSVRKLLLKMEAPNMSSFESVLESIAESIAEGKAWHPRKCKRDQEAITDKGLPVENKRRCGDLNCGEFKNVGCRLPAGSNKHAEISENSLSDLDADSSDLHGDSP